MTLSDQTKTWSSPGPTTLQSLIETIGMPLLHVLMAPKGLALQVRGTAIYDAADPIPQGQDLVLLLVGTRVDGSAALQAVRQAAAHGFLAVVVKLRGADAIDLVAEAARLDLTVLATADDMPWRHLDALMASVLGAGRGLSEFSGSGGEALFTLANALAGVIGGSVAIEDLEQHVLAYSSLDEQRIDPLRERGILDRQVPDLPAHRAQYLRVLQSDGVVRFPEFQDELPRAAVAVRAGDLPLGTIWAIEGEGDLTGDCEQALLDGSRIAALHMLRGQGALEREQRLRGEVLRVALAGGYPSADFGERLGLTAGEEYALVAFAPVDAGDHGPLMPRVGDAVNRYVGAYRPEAVTATMPHAVYVLVPAPGQSVRRLAEGVLPVLQRAASTSLRGAITAPSRDPADLVPMRREADAVLRAAVELAGDASMIVTVADVHSRLILDLLADQLERDPRLRHPGVEELRRHDRKRGSGHAATVLAWLDAQGDVTVAAEMLSIHRNTLRYRLRRIQERFGLDLDNPEVRLSTWLQLRGLSARN